MNWWIHIPYGREGPGLSHKAMIFTLCLWRCNERKILTLSPPKKKTARSARQITHTTVILAGARRVSNYRLTNKKTLFLPDISATVIRNSSMYSQLELTLRQYSSPHQYSLHSCRAGDDYTARYTYRACIINVRRIAFTSPFVIGGDE